jgi:MFS family permease
MGQVSASHQLAKRSIFLNLSLFQFLSFVRRGVFYSFMINYLFSLMKTVTWTASLGTLNMLGSALGQNLLWGKISDRYKLRIKLIIMGESIAATAYLIVFLTHKSLIEAHADFAAGLSIIFGLSILEFFWSMSDVGWATLLTEVTTSKSRGKIVGSLNFIASVGRMIGIIFAGFLYNNGEGFRQGTIFYIVIAMLAASTAIMWITSKSEPTARKTENITTTTVEEKVSTKQNEEIYKWFLLSLIIIVIGAASTNQVFILFLEKGLRFSDAERSLILTAWTLGGMLISLLSGWLADKIGRVRTIFIGLSLAIVTPLIYSSISNVFVMALVYGLNGVSFWTMQIVGFIFAGDIIPADRRGRLFSRYNAAMALSWGPAGLFIGGPLADIQTKSLGLSDYAAYVNTFYASAIIVTLGTILFALKVARIKPELSEPQKSANPKVPH